ncbi:hypothetical protein ZWY2020_012763 [Hordeum vulgare]|nr:hypothetical protein ZWY2020_012763 [Hordeum vulgare]
MGGALLFQGLLFVWPDENGWDRANATKPPILQYCSIGWKPTNPTTIGDVAAARADEPDDDIKLKAPPCKLDAE